jgi:hypothetical protein
MHRRLIIAASVALVTAATAAAAVSPVEQVVLKPEQVGAGYRLKTLPHGNEVKGQVSLDLCGFSFPSERYRVARLQVAYVRAGAPSLSNEVVEYASGGRAAQALAELFYAEEKCPAGPVKGPVANQPPITYRLRPLSDRHLLKPSLAAVMHLTATVKGKRKTWNVVVVYQSHGTLLSAVYSDGKGSVATQKRLALHAAEQAAQNLTRAG